MTSETKAYLERLSDDEILRTIRKWVQHLAAEEFPAATEMLDALPDGTERYSPEKLKEAIGMYSRAFRSAGIKDRDQYRPRVTDPAVVSKGNERIEIYESDTGESAIAEYSMPLDGRWSDLTAVFEVFPRDGGYRIGLYDIRVL